MKVQNPAPNTRVEGYTRVRDIRPAQPEALITLSLDGTVQVRERLNR